MILSIGLNQIYSMFLYPNIHSNIVLLFKSSVNTPIFLSALALHICSYCPLIGIDHSFLPKTNASDVVENPEAVITPLQLSKSLVNLFLSNFFILSIFGENYF